MIQQLLTRLRFLLRRPQPAELDEELQFHVDQAIQANLAAGLPPDEARRQAMIEFGGMERTREQCNEQRPGWWMGTAAQDVRYALRGFRRNPVFAITAVATLALGIGATTAIFSAVNALLLRPLPYKQADRLVGLTSVWPTRHENVLISPDFVAAQSAAKSFSQFGGYCLSNGDNLTGAGGAVQVSRANVTANLFPLLGVMPQLGRNFLSEEDRIGGPLVILLSDRLWRDRFHADPGIVGKAATLNGVAHTVVGVLPAHFSFPDPAAEPDYYAPADFDQDTTVSFKAGVWMVRVIARLRPGASMEQAQAEMQAFFDARAKGYPAVLAPWSDGRKIAAEPLQRAMTGDDRKPLFILLISVAAVLLISCANVANLQLARAISRRHETSLRGALGASRLRLIRQFLVESLALSSLAAALGLAIALAVTSLVRHAAVLEGPQASLLGRTAQMLRLPFGKLSAVIEVDGWVLAFTVGLALITTLLFGLAPAISGTRSDLRNALQASGSRMTSGRQQRLLRHTLLVTEVGMAVVLLASAGLLVRSFVNVLRYDSGFDPSHTLIGETHLQAGVATLHGPSAAWPAQRFRSFMDGVLLRLTALPGVEAAGATDALPLDGRTGGVVVFDGVPVPPLGERPFACVTHVTPDYFRAVGTQMFAGRGFGSADNASSLPVAIVNRTFAKKFFAGDALGKRFRTNAGPDHEMEPLNIVGVVDDVRHDSLLGEVQPEAFLPMSQVSALFRVKFVLRIAGNPALLANALRGAVAAVDPEQPVFDIQTMDQRIGDMVAQRRLTMLLIACFAMLAVVLSAVGVYGVFACSVTQRAHELGIRLALGASRGGLLRMVLMQAARLVLLGGVLGLGAAWSLNRLLADLLVGVAPHDALSLGLAWGLMTAVALLAGTLPAADAARIDLISVLHAD
jgi:predicted permease